MTIPTISLIFGATAALLNMWLGMRCGRVRVKEGINHGDGGNPLLARRIRAQLNFAENTPLVLFLTLALELAGFAPFWLWMIASFYIIARVLHALGMDQEGTNLMRGAGVVITMLATLTLLGCALYTGYHAADIIAPPASVGNHA